MKFSIAVAALVLTIPLCAFAQGGPVLTVPVTGKRTLVVVPSPQVQDFEKSLRANTGLPNSTLLTWLPYPGAHGYRVLRAPNVSTTPVTFEVQNGSEQYTATVIPDNDFVFSVVAIDASGGALDTTAAINIRPKVVGNPPPPRVTCSWAAGTITLSWSAVPGMSDYRVFLQTPPAHKVGHQHPSGGLVTLVDSSVVGTSFTQSGLTPAFNVYVEPQYALQDYPTPGNTTRASISRYWVQVVDKVPAYGGAGCYPP